MFTFFKKRKLRDEAIAQEMVMAIRFRENLDRILVTYSLQADPTSRHKLLGEVAQVVVLITKKAMEFSGKDYENLSEKEAFAVGLVTIVAADHLSRLARVEFELTGLAAGHALWTPLFGASKSAEIVTSAASEFNRLSQSPGHSEIIIAIGKNVANFFNTNDLGHIQNLRKPLEFLYARALNS